MTDEDVRELYALTKAVRRLFHKLGHGVGLLHEGSEINMGMRAVLENIVKQGPQTVPAMAQIRPVTRQHIQGLVNALIASGYAEYRDNPAHRRSHLVVATDKGRAAFQSMRMREDAAFRALRIDAGAEEIRAARELLAKLIAIFDDPGWMDPNTLEGD